MLARSLFTALPLESSQQSQPTMLATEPPARSTLVWNPPRSMQGPPSAASPFLAFLTPLPSFLTISLNAAFSLQSS